MRATIVLVLLLSLFALVPTAAAAEEIWISHPFEGQITIHDRSGALVERIRDTFSPASMALSPDGSTIAVVDFALFAIDIYDAASRTIVDRFIVEEPHGNGEHLIYTPDGRYLWYYGASGIEIYSVPDYEPVGEVPTLFPFGLEQIATDGRWMYTVAPGGSPLLRMSFDGSIQRDTPTGMAAAFAGLAYAGGHLWIADPSAGRLQQRTVPGGRLVGRGRLARADLPGQRLIANPSGTRVLNVHSLALRNTVVDTSSGRRVRSLRTRRCLSSNAAFLDDEWAVMTCFNRFFGLLNVETGAKKWVAVKGGSSWDVIVRD